MISESLFKMELGQHGMKMKKRPKELKRGTVSLVPHKMTCKIPRVKTQMMMMKVTMMKMILILMRIRMKI